MEEETFKAKVRELNSAILGQINLARAVLKSTGQPDERAKAIKYQNQVADVARKIQELGRTKLTGKQEEHLRDITSRSSRILEEERERAAERKRAQMPRKPEKPKNRTRRHLK
jgi:hypothetical protein